MKKPVNSQLPLPIVEVSHASFDNFLVGEHTELIAAIKACVNLGEPGMVYFYGPKSVGKSHLMHAAVRLAKAKVMNSHYVSLAHPNASIDMLESLDNHHLVCIDDIQYWSGHEAKERALFNLFEQLKQAQGQLLISSNAPPDASGFALTDLISRLSSGLVYPLRVLTEQQQFEAITYHVSLRGLKMEQDVVRYLLSRASRDTAELFKLLDKIDHASLVEKRRITIPFLKTVLNG